VNILERKNAISTFYNILDIGGERTLKAQKVKVDVNQYWETLRVMPLLNYIPGEVIMRLHQIMLSGRLMNKPEEKFKMMNELLAPFKFKPLASGTNRRTFYCEYDSRVIVKIATDRVGRVANIREYNVQTIAKPFCPKIFELGYDGVVILSERVEPMTEEQYRKVYALDIFDVIVNLLRKGYIVEDIGTNFFKNFGVRMGFGPVIVDFGDIYKVDYRKLKCHRIADLEGNICGGTIDYDYTKGMSEIICTKCGTRYSAKYLEDLDPSESYKKIVQGGSFTMRRINSNLKVSVIENGKYISGYMANEPDYKIQQRRVQAEAIQRNRPEESADVQQFVQQKQNTIVTEATPAADIQPTAESISALNGNVPNLNPFSTPSRVPNITASVYTPVPNPVPPAPPIINQPKPQYQIINDPARDLTSSQKMHAITDDQAAQMLATQKTPVIHNTAGLKIPTWSNYTGKDGVTYLMYPKEVKNKIIYFLKGVERDFGYNVAEFLAAKLEIYYIKNDRFNRDHESINMIATPNDTAAKPQTIKATVVNPVEPKKEVTPQPQVQQPKPYKVPSPIPEFMIPKEKYEPVEKLQNSEEVNKPLENVINGNVTSNWIGMNPNVNNINPDAVTQNPVVINEMKKEMEIPASKQNIVVEKETPKDTTIVEEEKPELKVPPERPTWIPNEGLFPMEPKGVDSVKTSDGNSVMGFPGEPLIDTLRQETEMPKIKELVRAKFNSFIKEINPDDQCTKLSSEIKLFVAEDIKKILNDDGKGLEVIVKPEVDHLSRECFHVSVENYSSPLFDLLIYPLDQALDRAIEAKEEEAKKLMEREDNLVNYLNSIVSDFDASGINDVEEVKSKLKAYIFAVLSDRYEGYLTVPFRQNAAEYYVDKYCDFTKAESAEETSTAVNENKN